MFIILQTVILIIGIFVKEDNIIGSQKIMLPYNHNLDYVNYAIRDVLSVLVHLILTVIIAKIFR